MEALPPFTRRSFGALRSQAEPGNERKGRLLSRSERRRFIDLEWRLCLHSRGGASGPCVPRQSLGTREKEGYFRGAKGDDSLTWNGGSASLHEAEPRGFAFPGRAWEREKRKATFAERKATIH